MAKGIREKPIHNLTSDRLWADTTMEVCLCGNDTFYIVAKFRDGDISGWFTNALCANCNIWCRVPSPVDKADDLVTA